jgi:hypothetical protein
MGRDPLAAGSSDHAQGRQQRWRRRLPWHWRHQQRHAAVHADVREHALRLRRHRQGRHVRRHRDRLDAGHAGAQRLGRQRRPVPQEVTYTSAASQGFSLYVVEIEGEVEIDVSATSTTNLSTPAKTSGTATTANTTAAGGLAIGFWANDSYGSCDSGTDETWSGGFIASPGPKTRQYFGPADVGSPAIAVGWKEIASSGTAVSTSYTYTGDTDDENLLFLVVLKEVATGRIAHALRFAVGNAGSRRGLIHRQGRARRVSLRGGGGGHHRGNRWASDRRFALGGGSGRHDLRGWWAPDCRLARGYRSGRHGLGHQRAPDRRIAGSDRGVRHAFDDGRGFALRFALGDGRG